MLFLMEDLSFFGLRLTILSIFTKPSLMASQTVLEKLQYNNERNVLVQGLPSTIEKQFQKFNFAKSVTPLLKSRKIDFAIVFAVSIKQLEDILNGVMPALQSNARLWIAHPKQTAKIASDLCRQDHWQVIEDYALEAVDIVELDNVWCATQFKLDGVKQAEKNTIPKRLLVAQEEEVMVG